MFNIQGSKSQNYSDIQRNEMPQLPVNISEHL